MKPAKIVIDADIAHSASIEITPSERCLQFLQQVFESNILVVVCEELWAEYLRHGQYFLVWLASVESDSRVEHRHWPTAAKTELVKRLWVVQDCTDGEKESVRDDLHLLYLSESAKAPLHTREQRLQAKYNAKSGLGQFLRTEFGKIVFVTL